MADVAQSPIGFQMRTGSHATSSLGFGFGLTSSTVPEWQQASSSQTMPFHQLTTNNFNHSSLSRTSKKRGLEDDSFDSKQYQDESMENRSPTPDRPKKAPPKRIRVSPSVENPQKDGKPKDNKQSGDEVDVGVLLASLPAETLLPILTSLLGSQPSLKSSILPLIPRPALSTALHALHAAAKKLTEAYPYSMTSSPSQGLMAGAFSGSTMGFGGSWPQIQFGNTGSSHIQAGMRDTYIQSRIRPRCTDFISACLSYLPYFSCSSQISSRMSPQQTQSSSLLQPYHKDKSHVVETFQFLCALTRHIISQPLLAQEQLAPMVSHRLSEEWFAWVRRVDEIVNKEAGMFGSESVSSWFRELDGLESAQKHRELSFIRSVRDMAVEKVGWLVGRSGQPMQI